AALGGDPRRLGRQRAVHAFDADSRLLQPLVHLAPVELGQASLRAWHLTLLIACEAAEPAHPKHVCLDLGLGHTLSHEVVAAGPLPACQLSEPVDCPLETGGVGEPVPLEA